MKNDYNYEVLCSRLQTYEIDAFSAIVTALRVQGPLSAAKLEFLSLAQSLLHISTERRKAEIRRVANDELLSSIAVFFDSGTSASEDWQKEGQRTVPLLPSSTATSVSDRTQDCANYANKLCGDARDEVYEALRCKWLFKKEEATRANEESGGKHNNRVLALADRPDLPTASTLRPFVQAASSTVVPLTKQRCRTLPVKHASVVSLSSVAQQKKTNATKRAQNSQLSSGTKKRKKTSAAPDVSSALTSRADARQRDAVSEEVPTLIKSVAETNTETCIELIQRTPSLTENSTCLETEQKVQRKRGRPSTIRKEEAAKKGRPATSGGVATFSGKQRSSTTQDAQPIRAAAELKDGESAFDRFASQSADTTQAAPSSASAQPSPAASRGKVVTVSFRPCLTPTSVHSRTITASVDGLPKSQNCLSSQSKVITVLPGSTVAASTGLHAQTVFVLSAGAKPAAALIRPRPAPVAEGTCEAVADEDAVKKKKKAKH